MKRKKRKLQNKTANKMKKRVTNRKKKEEKLSQDLSKTGWKTSQNRLFPKLAGPHPRSRGWSMWWYYRIVRYISVACGFGIGFFFFTKWARALLNKHGDYLFPKNMLIIFKIDSFLWGACKIDSSSPNRK